VSPEWGNRRGPRTVDVRSAVGHTTFPQMHGAKIRHVDVAPVLHAQLPWSKVLKRAAHSGALSEASGWRG